MKASITSKGVLKLALFVLLSLWAGYATGYRHGVRDDQREWWASVRLDSQGKLVFFGPQAKSEFDPYFVRQNPVPEKLDR